MKVCRRCCREVESTIKPMNWCDDCFDYERNLGKYYINYSEYLKWKENIKKR